MSTIVLKLSGEVLAGNEKRGIDPDTLKSVANSLARAVKDGAKLAVILGGGNFIRGLSVQKTGISRVTGDQMGMIATVMNGLALRDAIVHAGAKAELFTAFAMDRIGKLYTPLAAQECLDSGALAILSGGTGNPFFSTDTGSALRAAELGCRLFLKGTKVDGVYNKDPAIHSDAVRYDELTIEDMIDQKLAVIDLTAATMCRENGIDIRVYRMTDPDIIYRAAMGEAVGTLVRATSK
jgi:uridylate kinase